MNERCVTEGEPLLPLIFNFSVVYAIWKVQENIENLNFMEHLTLFYINCMEQSLSGSSFS